MKTIFILSFFFLASIIFTQPSIIKGKIIIKDENGKKENVILKSKPSMYIQISFMRDGKLEPCNEKFWVDDDSLEFKAEILGTRCKVEGKKLYLELKFDFGIPYGWIIKKSLQYIIFKKDELLWDNREIELIRLNQYSNNNRSGNYNIAREAYIKSPGKSLFYFIEASKGNDIAFTAKSINFLHSKGNKKMEYEIYNQKDFDSIRMSDLTRFKFFMNKGYAARAVKKELEALNYFAKAQKIYPYNKTPISVSYTIVKDKVGVKGYSGLLTGIDAHPKLKNNLKAVYLNWNIKGKPSLSEFEKMNKDALKFISENIKAFEK